MEDSYELLQPYTSSISHLFYSFYFLGLVFNSTIIGGNVSYQNHLSQFLTPAVGLNPQWLLCYRASIHGWADSTFHSRCDGKNHTVTLIKNGQYVFGGYTDIPWGMINFPFWIFSIAIMFWEDHQLPCRLLRYTILSYDPYGPARHFLRKLFKKVPYEGCMRLSDRASKMCEALVGTRSAKSIRVIPWEVGKFWFLQNEQWKWAFWQRILLSWRTVLSRDYFSRQLTPKAQKESQHF